MASYTYRSSFENGRMPARLNRDPPSSAFMAEHWAKQWGIYVHKLDGYNASYIDGHAEWLPDSRHYLIGENVSHTNWGVQERYWQEFFDQ